MIAADEIVFIEEFDGEEMRADLDLNMFTIRYEENHVSLPLKSLTFLKNVIARCEQEIELRGN